MRGLGRGAFLQGATGTVALGYGVAIDGYPGNSNTSRSFGTSNAVYPEDNYFELYRHAVTSGNGASYVARHNTCKNNYQDAQSFDAHGKTSNWPRGSVEIYKNTINNSIVRWAGCQDSRWLRRGLGQHDQRRPAGRRGPSR